MQLSVVILNYNVRYFLELCVLSVKKALINIDSEIIVVDNNSQDESCAMMAARYPEIKLIRNKENVGFPRGNNLGVAQAKGKYVCILNPDTVVAEDTFEKLLTFIKTQSNLGIVGCKLIDGTGNFLPESKRGVPTPFVAFTKMAGLYRLLPKSSLLNKYYAQHLNENQTGKVDVLVGAFMFLSRDLYRNLGGFDEDCFMYSDDIDLSYRALQLGFSNVYFHETTVIHFKGESTVKDETYMKRFKEAMNYFYKKHFKASPFFSLFMNAGITIFSLVKMFEGTRPIKILPDAHNLHYILYSLSETTAKRLSNVLQKKVQFHDLKKEKMVISSPGNKQLMTKTIFDNEFVSFKDSIQFMEASKSKHTYYRFLPENGNFFIGSDSSNGRGEVVKI